MFAWGMPGCGMGLMNMLDGWTGEWTNEGMKECVDEQMNNGRIDE